MASIDVGGGSGLTSSAGAVGYTYVSYTNPSNATGWLESVTMRVFSEQSGCRVGTMDYDGSGTDYSGRDSVSIGTVASGSNQTFSGLWIAISVGDFLAWYADSGGKLCGSTGAVQCARISGDYLDNSGVTMSPVSYSLNLSGAGTTVAPTTPGECDISSVSSLSADPSAIFVGSCPMSSTPSLQPVAGAIRNASTPIESIASLDITGLRNKFGVLSIVAVPSLYIDIRAIARCAIISESSLSSSANVIFSGVVPIDIISSLISDGSAGVLAAVTILSVASITAAGVKSANGAVTITARSSADIAAISYITQLMGYTGTLTAGDVLVIDCDEQTVELNGSNATRYFTGQFPMLEIGDNLLVWEDGGEVPDLTFETKHRPRYL